VKEHFVPQFYLNYFAASDGLINVHDMGNNTSFRNKAKQFCYEKDFYELKDSQGFHIERNLVENKLSEFEGMINSTLTCLIERCTYEPGDFMIDSNEFTDIIMFIILQLLRHPETKEHISELYGKGVSEPLGEIDKNTLYIANTMPISVDNINSLFKGLENEVHPYTRHLVDDDKQLLNKIASFFVNKCIVHIALPKSKEKTFLTCDNPVLKNIPFSDAEFILPLSPQHLAVVSKTDSIELRYHWGKAWYEDSMVDRINALIKKNATRFIFGEIAS